MVICGRGEPSPATAQVLRFGTKAIRVVEEKDTLCRICQSAVELDNVFENAQAVKGRATWLERPDPALDPRLNCISRVYFRHAVYTLGRTCMHSRRQCCRSPRAGDIATLRRRNGPQRFSFFFFLLSFLAKIALSLERDTFHPPNWLSHDWLSSLTGRSVIGVPSALRGSTLAGIFEGIE